MEDGTADLSIRRESLLSAASNVVIVVAQLATLGVLARALGPSGLGIYFYAVSAAMIAIIPSRELSQIMRKRVSEVDSPSSEFFGFAQAGTLLYLLVFAVGLGLVGPVLVAATPLTSATVGAFGVYTAALTQSAMSTRLYDAVGSPGASMISQAVRDAALLGAVLTLLHVGVATPRTVLLVAAGVHLTAALGIYAMVGLVPRVPSQATLVSGFDFGKWSAPTGVASRLWEEAPTLVLGSLLGGSAVALYETARRVTMVGAYLATCINDPLLVKVSAMDSTDAEVHHYVRLALDYTPSVAIPALFVFAPVTSAVLTVAAGPTFASGGLVLLGVASMHVLSGLKTPIAAALHGVDRPRYVFYLTVATLLVGAPAITAAASVGGVVTVVGVMVVLELAGVLASVAASYYTFGRFIVPRTLHVQVAAATVAAGVVWAVSSALDLTSGRTLIALLACGFAVHFAIFALTCGSFRRGSVRTVRELRRVLERAAPT